MLVLERFRERKRQLGIPEGIVESLTPVRAQSIKIAALRDVAMLQVARGKAYGEKAGVWYRVTFPMVIHEAEVVAVGEAKTTSIVYRDIGKVGDVPIPTVTKPDDVDVASITKPADVKVASITKPADVSIKEIERVTTTREDIEARTKRHLGDWGRLWNWLRDWLAWVGSFIGYFVHSVLIQPQIDRVQDSINTTIRDFNSKTNLERDRIIDAVNLRIGDFNTKINLERDRIIDAVNLRIGDFNTKINDQTDYLVAAVNSTIETTNEKVNSQTDGIADRVNVVLRDLYSMWGLPRNIAMAPVHTRNVSDTGFEFLSLGKQTVHWIAIGERA